MLTGCLIYNDKTTNEVKTRLGYIMAEPSMKQNTDKFKGYAELSSFYDGADNFNKIPVEFFGNVVIATLENKPNPRNPLREVKVIKSLKLGSNVVTLV